MTLEQLMDAEPFVIIIRCIHTRGEAQAMAVKALQGRRLWLSEDQLQMAGLDHAYQQMHTPQPH